MNIQEFEAMWLKKFVPHLTKEQYDDCYVDQYLWHVFSFEMIPKTAVLTGDAARKAYEAADKDGAIMLRLWDVSDDVHTERMTEQYKQVELLDEMPETYVVGKDWEDENEQRGNDGKTSGENLLCD